MKINTGREHLNLARAFNDGWRYAEISPTQRPPLRSLVEEGYSPVEAVYFALGARESLRFELTA